MCRPAAMHAGEQPLLGMTSRAHGAALDTGDLRVLVSNLTDGMRYDWRIWAMTPLSQRSMQVTLTVCAHRNAMFHNTEVRGACR